MDPNKRDRFLKRGALGLYCLSCVTMATTSLVAVAVAAGVAGLTPVSTPLDGFLRVWGLPLLLVSVAIMLWTIRRSSRVAIALTGGGGLVTALAMLAMAGQRAPSATSDGMAGMQSDVSTVNSILGIALPFWIGASLLVSGYISARRTRRHSSRREAAIS